MYLFIYIYRYYWNNNLHFFQNKETRWGQHPFHLQPLPMRSPTFAVVDRSLTCGTCDLHCLWSPMSWKVTWGMTPIALCFQGGLYWVFTSRTIDKWIAGVKTPIFRGHHMLQALIGRGPCCRGWPFSTLNEKQKTANWLGVILRGSHWPAKEFWPP